MGSATPRQFEHGQSLNKLPYVAFVPADLDRRPLAADEASGDQELPGAQSEGKFASNPIVYFLMTDRFCGGADGAPVTLTGAPGSFFGGRLAGITRKLEQGWFSALGVNALWITAPYQQILGSVPGDGGFDHYAYHGYWPLDFTMVDSRFGSEADLEALVSAAHKRGIKVILDVVMSHSGYPDPLTLAHLLPLNVGVPFETFDEHHPQFDAWWGRQWVDFGAYVDHRDGGEIMPGLANGLPRFRTDHDGPVRPPAFVLARPESRVVPLPDASVEDYLLVWLTDWVRRFGIDGFRCDSVKHVGCSTWQRLKHRATSALIEWQQSNSGQGDFAPFWMTGEVYGHGIERSRWFDAGFDSLINFQFQAEFSEICRAGQPGHFFARRLYYHRLDVLYQHYADTLAGGRHGVLSFVSSHDTGLFDRARMTEAGTALLLAPGGVQIFYGDETARPEQEAAGPDIGQTSRSAMNWEKYDAELLAHWRMLGQFRSRHPSICRGRHRRLSEVPYVFVREDQQGADRVLVVLGHHGGLTLDVRGIFADGCWLRDAHTQVEVLVVQGVIECEVDEILLLELAGDEENEGREMI